MTKPKPVPSQQRGFTLIELMIALVIMAIIMTVAIPGYRGYVMRANRADATTALLRIAAAQEKFYLQNGTYATNAQLAPAPPNGLGIGTTERGYYDLEITNATATQYEVEATASGSGPQRNDDDCQTFRLNERGERESGPGDITDCWK